MLNQKDSPGDCRRTMQHWICAAGRGGGLGFPVCWCVSSARCCRYQYFARSGDRLTCCMSCYREGTIVFLHQRSSFKPQSHLLKNKRYHCLPSRIGESDQTNKSTCCNASRHVYGPNMIGRTVVIPWLGDRRCEVLLHRIHTSQVDGKTSKLQSGHRHCKRHNGVFFQKSENWIP